MRAVALVVLAACAGGPILVKQGRDGDYAPRIDDAATWSALAAKAGTDALARVEVVKVILDRDDGKLYFTQSRRWPVHFDFARMFLARAWDRVNDQRLFNEREYHDPERRFVLGSVTRYLDQDRWTFELAASDTFDLPATAKVFARVKGAVYFGDRLAYRPVPGKHTSQLAVARSLMPVVTTDELFANVVYQPLEVGEAIGVLRIVPAGAPVPADLKANEVVVLGTQPLELPPVAGIITDELQAPLGHIAILAHTRRTPNMARRGATTLPELTALAGKPVRLLVGATDYRILPATQDELVAAGQRKRAAAPRIKLDLRDRGLPALADIDPDDVAVFGAKTAHLARVARAAGVATPRAFGLPFAAYAKFLAANGLDRRVKELLADTALRADPVKLRAALEQLRAAIAAAPIPAAIVDPLHARIGKLLAGPAAPSVGGAPAQRSGAATIRLRSSTNAEDLEGFSGAGLYTSARIDPASRADLERGLRVVWGSVWGYEAFSEREWYGIDHARVAMAILVQESIDDDVVNGVAITGNPFFEGRPAVYINAQIRGGSVTGAAGNEVPEQILYYTYVTGRGIERISESSRARGRTLIPDGEVARLGDQLQRIHLEFTGEDVGSKKAVDVEFLIRANRQIVVVQARPYTIHWTAERRTPK